MSKLIIIAVLSLILLSFSAYAQELPDKPVNYVSDFAGIVDPDFEAQINQLAKQLEANTSSQIFVAAIEDTSPLSPKEYATKLFEKWKPGTADKDNGVIVLIAFKPERRVEIETGYGVEGVLPDSKVARIAREFAPLLTQEKYGEGLYNIVSAIGRVIEGSGEFEGETRSTDYLDIGGLIFWLIAVIFIIVISFGLGRSSSKCPDCKIKMKKVRSYVSGDYIIEDFVCKKCRKRIRKKRKKSRYHCFIFIGGSWGGGSGGGGFGGGGGGSSGGGGGGSGF